MFKHKISLKLAFLLIGLLLISPAAKAQKLVLPKITNKEWVADYPPFRIAGNLYYVGTVELGCYLITTPRGHILINTGVSGSDSLIKKHIELLGFKFADIKILLNNQAHFDHVGAMAAIKKATGAKVMINAADAPVIADGGNSDFDFGGKGSLFEPFKANRLLHEHDTIKLGGMRIVALHHPGHTKGATSFLFKVKDGKRSYRVLIANMPTVLDETILPGMPTYPNSGKDYARTFKNMKSLRFDIWLAAHTSQCGLQQKHQPGDAYRPEAFFDQKGYDAELEELHLAYLKKLEKDKHQ